MGYKLYREIIEHAPWDWTRGERLVALIIADDARDKTRRSWLPLYELCARSGYTAVGVRRVLERLGRRGFEFRVSHGVGSDGRHVYATKGHRVDYFVPHMPKGDTRVAPLPFNLPVDNYAKGDTHVSVNTRKGDTPVSPDQPKGDTDGAQRRYAGIAPPLRSPQIPGVAAVDGPVEGDTGAVHRRPAPGADSLADSAAIDGWRPPAGMSRLERAAWQASQSRQRRKLAGLTGEPQPGGDDLGPGSRITNEQEAIQ